MRLKQQLLTQNDCYRVRRTIQPKGVMVHSTGANNPKVSRYVPGDEILGFNANGNHWDRPGLDKCVHAFIGVFADGGIGTVQTLPWNARGWHAGKGKKCSANNTHISFEICEDSLTDPVYFQAAYQEAVELTAYLCREYGLDPLADGVVICHQEGYRRGIASNHGDVLHWFPKFRKSMDDFRRDVAQILKGEDDMTEDQVRKLVRDELARIEAESAARPVPDWAKELYADAVARGITDGSRPMAAATRLETAIMVNAAAKLSKKESSAAAEDEKCVKEIDGVRCTLQAISYGMKGEEIRNSEGFYCQLVPHGVLEQAYEVLRRYEKLLAGEPLVEQIADDWRKSGKFSEGPKGVI